MISPGRSRAAPFLLLVVAAGVVYANSLLNGFALDDTAIILNNTRVHDLSDLGSIWLTPYWPYFGVQLGLWRPLTIFVYAIQWAVGGGEPWVFHAVSVAMHAGVTVLVFLLLQRLTGTVAALAGALIFAVHPLHTEAVANVVGQAELLAAGATVGACLLHACRPHGLAVGWGRRLALLALFALAILSKEHAVVLPALLVIVDLAQGRVPLSRRGVLDYADRMIMPMLLLTAVLAAYLIARFGVLEGTLLGTEAGPQLHFLREEYRVLNALRAFPEFLRLLVFPYDMSADYSPAMILPVESISVMSALGGLLLVATLALALATPWHPAVGFPAAWFLITVLTVSNLFFPIGVLIAERTLYLPSVAVAAITALALNSPAARGLPTAARRIAPAALALVIVLFGVRTWVRNPDWKSTQSVLSSIIRDHPESYRAQWTHASWQLQLGKPDVARVHYEMALRIYPRDSQLLTEYADFLLNRGETGRALRLLEQAFALHSYVPSTTLLLGTAYLVERRYEDALRIADHALRTGFSHAIVMPLRAAALEGLGADDRALGTWRYVIRHSTLRSPGEWAVVARVLAGNGHIEDARRALRRGRGAAAGDSATVALMDAVERAIRAGCYGTDGRTPIAAADTRACAPEHEGPPVPGLQNANVSQNAMDPPAAPSPPRSGGTS